MNINEYTSANSWMSAMHEKRHSVSIVLCQALEKLMKDEKLSFPEAYSKLAADKRISCKDGDYDLTITD